MTDAVMLLLQQTTTTTSAQLGQSFVFDLQVGAVLGFAATLIGSFGVWYLSKCNRKKRIRKALVAELNHQELGRIVESLETDGPVDSEEGQSEYEVEGSELPPAGALPTTVYQSNAGNLGELPSDEVNDVVEYYSSLEAQKAIIKAIRNNEEVLSADKRDLHSGMPKLSSDKEDLVDKLGGDSD
jgi:hypothetical protein